MASRTPRPRAGRRASRARHEAVALAAALLAVAAAAALGMMLGRQAARSLRERERLLEELQRALRARDEFLSVASHELKTPLMALLLYVQGAERLLASSAAGPGLAAKVEGAARAAARLRRRVDDLLEVSRAARVRLTLEREPVDLLSVAGDVLDRLGADLRAAGCGVRLSARGPTDGSFDRARLEQVLGNLIENSMKYGRGQQIAVEVDGTDAASLVVCVTDGGIGIPPEDQARIFERFERAAPPREFGGLGLGLWMVREIVQVHGGQVTVDSRPGAGARFSVRLPRGRPTVALGAPVSLPAA